MANTAIALDIQEHADNIIEFPKKRVCNKKKGKKSEVYPYEIEDVKKLLNWFAENKMWTHYLALTLGINMARRIGDTLNLTWEHFFDPTTGDFRYEIMEIIEDKTDKMANPLINDAVKAGIRKYIEETGCDGIMVARAARGNPWIFREIIEYYRYTFCPEDIRQNQQNDSSK